jgi:AcrR family transcriptional regulator
MRADAARNRQQILVAAQRMIERDGPSVPLDDIARAAGVGAGTLHRHFPTKEGLLGEIVVDRVTAMTYQVSKLADAQNAGDALITAISLMLDEGDRSAVLKASLLGTDFDLRVAAPDAVEQLRSAVGQLLTKAQRANEIRNDIDTNDLMSLVAGAFVAEQHAGDRPNRQRLAYILFDSLRKTARSDQLR